MKKNWIYGDNVDTDVIIPARYLNCASEENLATHCMEDIDKTFATSVKKGDFIIAGYNFGCGSSREHAPLAIKASGIRAVIAKTFARIFYRNAINIGLVIIENDEIQSNIDENDEIDIDLTLGKIYNKTKNKEYSFAPYPAEIQKLINAGGLVEYTKQKKEK
ncbi:MAG: 3-isopropylmalate dehydratase small subunit [Candidatus Gastranaerophilales bacterium]|nr:3-isopropylmalate dehydratase small subunit [Candidatus Gastranaerophilales bacterium]